MSINCNLSIVIENIDIPNIQSQSDFFVEIEHEDIVFKFKKLENVVIKDLFNNDFDEIFNITVFSIIDSKAKIQGKGSLNLGKYRTLKEFQLFQNFKIELKCKNKLKGSINLKVVITDYDKQLKNSFLLKSNYNELVKERIKVVKIFKEPNLIYNYTQKIEEEYFKIYEKLPVKILSLNEVYQPIVFETNIENDIFNMSFQSISLDLENENENEIEINYDFDSDSNIKLLQTIDEEKKCIIIENLLINENSRLDINLEKK